MRTTIAKLMIYKRLREAFGDVATVQMVKG
jgi:hypothetical protein